MLVAKIVSLILYVILVYVAISFPLSLWSQFAIGLLVLLVLVHAIECFVFRDLMKRAPGGIAWHIVNLLLFGVVHKLAMNEALENAYDEQI